MIVLRSNRQHDQTKQIFGPVTLLIGPKISPKTFYVQSHCQLNLKIITSVEIVQHGCVMKCLRLLMNSLRSPPEIPGHPQEHLALPKAKGLQMMDYC